MDHLPREDDVTFRRRLWRPEQRAHFAIGLLLAVALPWLAAWLTSSVPPFERFPGIAFLIVTIGVTLIARLSAGIVATLVSAGVIATLDLGTANPPGGIRDDVIALIVFVGISGIVAYALASKDAAMERADRAREDLGSLARTLAAQRNQLQQIQAVSDAALSGLPFDDLADRLLRKLREVLETDAATLLLLDRTGVLVEHGTVGADTSGSQMPIPVGKGIAGTIASSVSPLVTDDVRTYPVERPWLIEQMRSLMGVPLVYRGQVRGVIHVTMRTQRRFTTDEVRVLELAAGRIASALERASLYDSRSAMARALQRSLLPSSLPEIAGVDLAALYLPHSETEEIGGDFYDVFPHGDGTWGVVIGDVAGKGPDAAAVMGLAAHSLRAFARYESRPSSMLAALNESLMRAERVQTERFCTACGIRVRAEASHLRATICLAGHPLPLLMHADGRVEQIGEAGTLLGSFADPELHDTTIDVMAGEALVAFTDGLVERRTLEIDEGERRLADLLSTCRDLSSARIVERIERELLGGDDLDDDVAVVVIAKR